MQKLEQRVSKLEALIGSESKEVMFIYIAALGQDDENITSTSTQTGKGHQRWERVEGESIADFRSRIEKDCLGLYASEKGPAKSYTLFNQYTNGALYTLRPKREHEAWGTYTNKGSDNTIHKVGGI